MTEVRKTYAATELLFAATVRCRKCRAGMAYPLDHDAAQGLRAWVCSAVLMGEASASAAEGHDVLHWTFYKVREETSVNNDGGHTTRPAGTVAMTVGKATCPQCKHVWESEPYSACGKGHHWRSGPCPSCGYAVGGGDTHSSSEGPAIECRYRDVVIVSAAPAEGQAG